MKVTRCMMKIVAVTMMVAAAVCAVVTFWDKILDLFYAIADKVEERKANCLVDSSEYEDFEDCEL